MENNDKTIPDSELLMPKPNITFERATARIDEIVRLLERGDAPLDESLSLFEEGAKLIKAAGKMLDEAEQKVVSLQRGDDGKPVELDKESDEH